MNTRDRLTLEQHDLKISMQKLLDVPTDKRGENYHAELSSLGTRLEQCSGELRNAILLDVIDKETVTATAPDAQEKEKGKLLEQANSGRIVVCALNGRVPDGADLECQQAYECGPDRLPYALMRHEAGYESPRVERGAVATAPDVDVGGVRPTVTPIVPSSLAGFLNVTSPSIQSGDLNYPALTTGSTVGALAKGASATESSPVYGLTTLQAGRLSTSVRISLEDEIRLPTITSDLSRNLLEALSDKLDNELLNRSNGFFGTGIVSTAPTNPGTEASYAAYSSALFGNVDGRYAATGGAVKMVVNGTVYAHMYEKVLTNTQRSAGELWQQYSGGLRVGIHVPAASSDVSSAVIARGSTPQAVAPLFGGGAQILRDPFSSASDGEIVIHIIGFASFSVLRSASYKWSKFKTA